MSRVFKNEESEGQDTFSDSIVVTFVESNPIGHRYSSFVVETLRHLFEAFIVFSPHVFNQEAEKANFREGHIGDIIIDESSLGLVEEFEDLGLVSNFSLQAVVSVEGMFHWSHSILRIQRIYSFLLFEKRSCQYQF